VLLALGSVVLFMGGCAPPVAETAGAPLCDSLIPAAASIRTVQYPRATRPPATQFASVSRLQSAPSRARSADDFVNSIGTNLHLSYFRTAYGTGWATIIKPKLLALGVRHVRDAGSVVDDDRWMEQVYGRMKELADQGIRFNLIVGPPRGSQDYSTLSHFGRLLQYALPVVESFEGLNEHDLSRRPDWVSEVRSCQQALYTAVKADPRTASLPVYGPSIGHPTNAAQVGDISQWMDFGSIHPYPGGMPPLANLTDHENKLQPVVGSRPLVATETGYHTATAWTGEHPAVSEQAMARYVPRLFLEYFDAGISRTYLYELIDEGTSNVDREQKFGLLRADGTEKPAYGALRNLIAVLRDPGAGFTPGELDYTLSGDTTGVETTLLQKRDGRFYLVLWQEAASYDLVRKLEAQVPVKQVTLQLTRAARVRLFLPLTSPNPTRDSQGVTTLQLSVPDSPLIVEISP